MGEEERKAIVARPTTAVGRISAGGGSVLSRMVSDALVLARSHAYRDAYHDESLRDWLNWLAGSSNAHSAQMGKWYLRHLEEREPPSSIIFDAAVDEPRTTVSNGAAARPKINVVLYINLEVEQLQKLIAQARSRLADLEIAYTKDRRAVDLMQATIFNLVRPHYQARDRLKLIVDYRQKYLNSLLKSGEDEAGQVTEDYQSAKAQTDDNYEQAASRI
jgi:hypothetical protein